MTFKPTQILYWVMDGANIGKTKYQKQIVLVLWCDQQKANCHVRLGHTFVFTTAFQVYCAGPLFVPG